jgi:hypothetical protein
MVPHLAPVVQRDLEALPDSRKFFDKQSAIVVMKDRLPIMAPTEDVIAKPLGLLQSPSQSSHESFPGAASSSMP